MEHSTFTPTGLGGTSDDIGMTPISRLIPQDSSSSGSGMRQSEQPPRVSSGQGAGGVPPMNPPAQTRDPMVAPQGGGDNGDIVNEILRDVERGASIQTQPPPPPPQYHQEGGRPTVRFETPPTYDYNQGSEEPPMMIQQTHEPGHIGVDDDAISDKDSENGFLGNNFVGTILTETKLPIIVAGLIFLAGLSNADEILTRLVPALFQDGNSSYAGLVVKAVIGGLLFYAIRKLFV